MNIMDIISNESAPEPAEGLDELDQLFLWQKDLEEKYLEIETKNGLRWDTSRPWRLNDDQSDMQLQDFSFRTVSELIEMTECLKNRPHKLTHMPTDANHFYEEFADSLHFLLGSCWLVGMDAEELFRRVCDLQPSESRLESMIAIAGKIEESDIQEMPQRRWVLDYPVDIDHPKGQLQIKDLTFEVIHTLMNMHDDVDRLGSPNPFLAHAIQQFLGLGWALGMSADDIYKVYWAKMRVNQFRQNTNY